MSVSQQSGRGSRMRNTAAADTSTDAQSSPEGPRTGSNILFTRQDEKKNLQALNDRFAAYIERARQLEIENQQLNSKVQTIEHKYETETRNVKVLYDKELQDLRTSLDDVSSERTRLQIEKTKIDAEYKELLQRFVSSD